MIGFVYSDGGRSQAGFKTKSAKDDLVCAIATLLGEHYKKWYTIVGMYSKRRGLPVSSRPLKHDMPRILEVAGLANVIVPDKKWMTYSEAYENHGDCIVLGSSRGIHCIKNGEIYAKNPSAQMREKLMPNGEFEWVERKTRNIWVKTKTERR